MSKNIRNFRLINEIEKKIINDSISKISPEIIPVLEYNKLSLFISFNPISLGDQLPHIYLIPNDLTKTVVNVEQETEVCSAGVYFGFIKIDQFYLSLEGTEFLYSLNIFPKNTRLISNDEGEKAILYGNNILKKYITKIPQTLKKNELVLILNNSKELISLALCQVNYSKSQALNPNNIIAQNLIDKGYYLRKKQ
jgi:ribosome biogenesis protein Nip4